MKLSTRKGTEIPNSVTLDMEKSQKDLSNRYLAAQVPGAILRSSDATYNCLGLAFASRRTHIDTRHTRLILTEDGYAPIASEDDLRVGDLVVYKDEGGEIKHVGIVVGADDLFDASRSRNIRVMSKWGEGGEFIHALRAVTQMFGHILEFWTDRKR